MKEDKRILEWSNSSDTEDFNKLSKKDSKEDNINDYE